MMKMKRRSEFSDWKEGEAVMKKEVKSEKLRVKSILAWNSSFLKILQRRNQNKVFEKGEKQVASL